MKPMAAGECYRNVVRHLQQNSLPSAKIIHGTILSISTGRRKRILHAWIEYDGDVIDPTQGVTINSEDYYRLVGAKVDARYTLEQAMLLSIRSGHWGPWIGARINSGDLYGKDVRLNLFYVTKRGAHRMVREHWTEILRRMKTLRCNANVCHLDGKPAGLVWKEEGRWRWYLGD